MELEDTIDGMLSDDYKERLKAEYQQVDIRVGKLLNYLENTKDIKDRDLLEVQALNMLSYSTILKFRLERLNCKSYADKLAATYADMPTLKSAT